MAIDRELVNEMGSDEWWFFKLLGQMHARPPKDDPRVTDSRRSDYTRNQWLNLLWSYHINESPIIRFDKDWSDFTQTTLRYAKTGYAGLLSTALLEKVRFTGVRVVSDVPDATGDDKMRRILSANGQALADAMEYSAVMGVGYVSISAGGPSGALLSAEDPRGMIDSSDPVTGDVRAVLKIYRDDDFDRGVAALYVLDDVNAGTYHTATYVCDLPDVTSAIPSTEMTKWTRDETLDAPVIPGHGIPIVPFYNKAHRGEAESHLDLLDRISDGIFDRINILKFQAYRQRAVIGSESIDEEIDDEDGTPLARASDDSLDDMFQSDPGSLWMVPEGVSFHEFSGADVNTALLPILADVKELSSASGVPLPLVMSDTANGSANGAELSREVLNNRAKDRIARWSPSVVKVARLAMRFAGAEVPEEIEAMADPVDRLSAGQIAQMAVAAGVPTEAIWQDVLQQSPETTKRWAAMRDQERLMEPIVNSPAFTGGA